MKVCGKTNKVFTPVELGITLETEEECAEFYALFMSCAILVKVPLVGAYSIRAEILAQLGYTPSYKQALLGIQKVITQNH